MNGKPLIAAIAWKFLYFSGVAFLFSAFIGPGGAVIGLWVSWVLYSLFMGRSAIGRGSLSFFPFVITLGLMILCVILSRTYMLEEATALHGYVGLTLALSIAYLIAVVLAVGFSALLSGLMDMLDPDDKK